MKLLFSTYGCVSVSLFSSRSHKVLIGFFGLFVGFFVLQHTIHAQFADVTASCAGVSEISQTECETLLNFYNAMNGGARSGITNPWGNTGAICGVWQGVSCVGSHVSYIDLPNNNVVGVLPKSLWDLSALTGLNVGNTHIPLSQGRFVVSLESSLVLDPKINPLADPNKKSKIIFIDLANDSILSFVPDLSAYGDSSINVFKDPGEIIMNNNDLFIAYNWQTTCPTASRADLTGRCAQMGMTGDTRPGALAKFSDVYINKNNGTVSYSKVELLPLRYSGAGYSGNLSSPHGTSKDTGYLYITYRRQSIITKVPLFGPLTGEYFNYYTTFGAVLSGSDISMPYNGRFYLSIQSSAYKGKIVSINSSTFGDPQTHLDFSTWGPYTAKSTIPPPFVINNNYLYTMDDYYYATGFAFVKKDLSLGTNLGVQSSQLTGEAGRFLYTVPHWMGYDSGKVYMTTSCRPGLTVFDTATYSRTTGTLITEVMSGYSTPFGSWKITEFSGTVINTSGYITDDNAIVGNRLYLAGELNLPGIVRVNVNNVANRTLVYNPRLYSGNYDIYGIAYAVDTTPPVCSVAYIYPTCSNSVLETGVEAYLTGCTESISVLNNQGRTGYFFTGNGTFEFSYMDVVGNTGMVIATVNSFVPEQCDDGNLVNGDECSNLCQWVAPSAQVLYDSTGWTNHDVYTFLTGYSVPLTNINATGYLFTGNGSFLFTFYNLVANSGSTLATVDWIDRVAPTAEVLYDITGRTDHDVYAFLTGYSEMLTGISASGYLFTGNGTFEFSFSDLAGNTGSVVATVTGIDKTFPTFDGVVSGASYATGVYIHFADNISGVQATVNGVVYTGGSLVTGNGIYTLLVSDLAGNVTGAIFTIQFPVCGNLVVEWQETCDDGARNGQPGYCNLTCTGMVPSWSAQHFSKDVCPGGRDLSPSYYDGICTSNPVPVPVVSGNFLDRIASLLSHDMPGSVSGSQYSLEMNAAYLQSYLLGITSLPTIQQAQVEGNLIRAHLAKMLSVFSTRVLGRQANTGMMCQFSDMNSQSDEIKSYATLSCQLGFMGLKPDGTPDTVFNPMAVVTRAQFGSALSRLLYGGYNNVLSGSNVPRYMKHLSSLQNAGIMKYIDTPDVVEQRGNVFVMLIRSLSTLITTWRLSH